LERLGEARAQVTADPRAMTRLLEAVERAKIALSEQTEYRLLEPFLTGEGSRTVQLDQVLTRADIDQVARPLIERTLRCIDEALADAKLSPQALDRVLLVGGASRSPVVREMVANHLQRPVLQDLDADRAVALGASLLAGRTAGIEVKDVLVDITPHTLAVGVEDGFSFSRRTEELAAAPVIPRNTVLPVERTRTVFTIFEDQPGVKIPVVQGESPRVGGNTQLGEVHVQDLPPSPANSPVEVTFRLDLSGILHVTARHVPSDRSAQIVIANSPYQLTAQRRDLDRLEVEALRRQSALAAQQLSAEEAERLASPEEPGDEEDDNEDEGEEPLEVLQERARSLLAKATGLLAIRQDADSPEFRNLRAAHNALKEALESGSPGLQDSIDALADALLDLEE
jgi:molecular chaperone DnaK